MSAVRSWSIACDFPDCDDVTADGEGTAHDARTAAVLANGWTYRNGRDLCPNHIDATAESIRAAGGER